MSASDRAEREYVAPTYRAQLDTAWYHFLYGSVPRHQIDLILRPEIPHGALAPQHFSHLLRLIKYIEPRNGAPFAFAVGNLSRDDTQFVPGHGGLALVFDLRVRGATDHAGRPDPPFSHAIAAIDRELDAAALEATAMYFYKRMIGDGARDSEGVAFYRAYAALGAEDAGASEALIANYLTSARRLPYSEKSGLAQAWCAEEQARPSRLVLVHPDDAPFSVIASCAARLAAILYRSDVRWTSITTGREADIENGLSIRMVPERDARGQEAAGGLVLRIGEIPREDSDAAWMLFGAKPMERREKAASGEEGPHERYAGGRREDAAQAIGGGEALQKAEAEAELAPIEITRPVGVVPADEAPTNLMPRLNLPAPLPAPPERSRAHSRMWVYISTAGAVCMTAIGMIYATQAPRALLLEPSHLEASAGALASALPKAGSGGTAERVASKDAPPVVASRPSPLQPAGIRGTGKRKYAPPSSTGKPEERPAEKGSIFRELSGARGAGAPE